MISITNIIVSTLPVRLRSVFIPKLSEAVRADGAMGGKCFDRNSL